MSDLDRYLESRETVLGSLRVSKDAEIAAGQLLELLGGVERALNYAVSLVEALVRRRR